MDPNGVTLIAQDRVGAKSFAHHKGEIDKLRPRTFTGILLGYSGEADAYLCLDLDTYLVQRGKIQLVVSRDAKLHRNEFPMTTITIQPMLRMIHRTTKTE